MKNPLAIDLYCGLGGWSEGLIAENYQVVGFDIERHRYWRSVELGSESVKRPGLNWSDRSKRGSKDAQFNKQPEPHPDGGWAEYPAQLVLQNVLTIHGSQFKDATLIVASPPCQEYSYMAMPWSRAKQIERALRGEGDFPDGYTGSRTVEELNALFDACFRIQREACEAAGRYIPMVVENVRGAQKWVGRAKWNFGSFYLWGDVPALMPTPKREIKGFGGTWFHNKELGTQNPNRNRVAPVSDEGVKVGNLVQQRNGHGHTRHLTNRAEHEGVKQGGDWFNASQPSISRMCGSKSSARKAASAQIAKIPFVLARHIAHVYRRGFAA